MLLDNLEQVIEAAPELASLVEPAPTLALLVTSRERLRVQGEVEYAVPPLAEPEAVELFCMRSQLAPSEEIAELCRRLDNLPLAVELAAARTRRSRRRRSSIASRTASICLKGGRDADPRQQTLSATIEWSYDLLNGDEQQLFARLRSSPAAARSRPRRRWRTPTSTPLQSLVEKSLLRFTDERYWMLETIREFAAERLGGVGRRRTASAAARPVLPRARAVPRDDLRVDRGSRPTAA